jgi:peroxiredoxin
MAPTADVLRHGVPTDAADSGGGRRAGLVAAGIAFAAFTVWINYAVRYVLPDTMGTVTALGELRVDEPAPPFTLTDIDGTVIALDSMRERNAILIEFWATWCPPCRTVLATLRDMAPMLQEQNVEVLSVNQGETLETVRSFVVKQRVPFRVLLDPEGLVATRYYVTSLPTMVLVDKGGIVRWIHVGHMPRTNELQDVLRRVTSG